MRRDGIGGSRGKDRLATQEATNSGYLQTETLFDIRILPIEARSRCMYSISVASAWPPGPQDEGGVGKATRSNARGSKHMEKSAAERRRSCHVYQQVLHKAKSKVRSKMSP